jgi:DNA ligase-associated metallophosphoesterase
LKLRIAGNLLQLMPERAVWWPGMRTAVVADVHLGKDQVFRRAGIAIPSAVLDAELNALDGVLCATRCERLLVLGDWVHAPPSDRERWPERVRAWRRRHRELAVDLVVGNHDRDIAPWLREWRITAHREPHSFGGLALFHEVDPAAPPAGLSGHLHPVAWLRAGRERIRLPVFARRDDHLVLPSFGRFTGGYDGLDPKHWRSYATTGERVVDLAAAAA